jgi:hypothetical protein
VGSVIRAGSYSSSDSALRIEISASPFPLPPPTTGNVLPPLSGIILKGSSCATGCGLGLVPLSPRFHYQLDDEGHVSVDNDSREVLHGWVKDADQKARKRYLAIFPERRQVFADAELKRRMQRAPGIFIN